MLCNKNNKEFKLHIENWKMAWEKRDFELSHLWQRSIFITTFIILVYTGYGAIWLNVLKSDINSFQTINITAENYDSEMLDNTNKNYQYKYNSNNDNLFMVSNCISIFIAILGYILSLLYIMMGKGSKYWYECYENLIVDIIEPKMQNEEGENKLYTMCKLWECEPSDKDKFLLSRNAGKFSVSKINILLGQISALVWFIILLMHITLLIYPKLFNFIFLNGIKYIFIAVIVTFSIIITICITCCLKHKVESR